MFSRASIALLMLAAAGVSDVNAYPAQATFKAAGQGSYAPSSFQSGGHATKAQACEAARVQIDSTAGAQGTTWRPVTVASCPAGNSTVTFSCGTTAPNGTCASGNVLIQTEALVCPNGTLSGSTCTCSSGFTDTGTSCSNTGLPCPFSVQAKPDGTCCPAGSWPVTGGSCRNACEMGEQSAFQGWEARKGSSYACHASSSGASNAFTGRHPWIVCQVVNTSAVTICDDDNWCYGSESTYHRFNGKPCLDIDSAAPFTAPTDPNPSVTPPAPNVDPHVCTTGEAWCFNDGTSPCGTNYSGGEFNGRNVCIKNGEPSVVLPVNPSNPVHPTPTTPVTPGTGPQPPGAQEVTNPGASTGGTQIVVVIGNGATSPTGSGSGSGTGGGGTVNVEVETCGLPGTPPCKIDETGTPDGAGVWDAAKTSTGEVLDATKDFVEGRTLSNAAPNPSGTDSRFSSWVGGSGSCSAIVFSQWTIDVCGDAASWLRSFLAFIYSVIGVIYVFHRGNEAIQGV